MDNKSKRNRTFIIVLFGLGLVGILAFLPVLPDLIEASGQKPPLPITVLQVLALLQSSVLLIVFVLVGAWSSKRVNLSAPLIERISAGGVPGMRANIIMAGLAGGVLGGLVLVLVAKQFLPHLPAEFAENVKAFTPPLYTRVLYGGITEEILLRWGLMSFVVWMSYRITQPKNTRIGAHNYILGIIISALLFGLGHIPAAAALSPTIDVSLVAYIVLANGFFGLIAGYLYWRRGLESAILAHITAHLVMYIGEKIA